jgi:cyclopropane fatty-acyl-phospholipid synthase-like methyltransferase
MNNQDFNKEFFQRSWGKDGYYEEFSYGVGIENVCKLALYPFLDPNKKALEIGCGGGVFTERMIGQFYSVHALDVIKMPDRFNLFPSFEFTELPDQTYECLGIESDSIDFAFSYNVFCHLSNEALTSYLADVNRVLKSGADFVFMLSNYRNVQTKQDSDKFGNRLPMGHFYQDARTLDFIMGSGWEVVDRNMIPEHRDTIIHLRKI